MKRILVYPDIDPGVGLGHLTRCVALAEGLKQKKQEVEFVGRSEHVKSLSYLNDLDFETTELSSSSVDEDLAELRRVAKNGKDVDWLIADNYKIDSSWLGHARSFTKNIAVIDDLANRFLDCDLLLNQNLGFENLYEGLVPASARLLLGPRYALLRREFSAARAQGLRDRGGDVNRILVFFGGADSRNNTESTIEALIRGGFERASIDVIVGIGYRFQNSLRSCLKGLKGENAIFCDVPVEQMIKLMQRADLMIGAAGSISWERCCLGLPSILLVIADNQRRIGEELDKQGVAKLVGSDMDISIEDLAISIQQVCDNKKVLAKMANRGPMLVDGQGVNNVVAAMRESA